MAVKVVIVLTRAESSILFWDEEEWGSLWGLGGYNVSGFQVFVNESLASLFFSRVE